MHALKNIQARYRYSLILLRQMVITDFKLRYQGSALGYVWSLLRPLFLFAILYVVFVKFLRIGADIPHYPVYLLTGIVLWNFFAEVTNNGVAAIVNRSELIRKLNFPKYVIILSVAASALINLFLNMIVVSIFLYASGVQIGASALITPLLILELFAFALGLAFILGALFVRLRDVNYIWEVGMQALFYATPIIYPLTMISERWPEIANVMLLNPVAQVIQDVRQAVITPSAQTIWESSSLWFALIPLSIVIMTFLCAVVFFKKRSPYFAEEV